MSINYRTAEATQFRFDSPNHDQSCYICFDVYRKLRMCCKTLLGMPSIGGNV